jgi:hypothetical protein
MRFLCISHRLPGADPDRIAALLTAEARAVWELHAEGTAQDVRFDPKAGRGILTLDCADDAAVQAALARLPLVAEGLIAFDTYELAPFTGFARLFAEDPRQGEERT